MRTHAPTGEPGSFHRPPRNAVATSKDVLAATRRWLHTSGAGSAAAAADGDRRRGGRRRIRPPLRSRRWRVAERRGAPPSHSAISCLDRMRACLSSLRQALAACPPTSLATDAALGGSYGVPPSPTLSSRAGVRRAHRSRLELASKIEGGALLGVGVAKAPAKAFARTTSASDALGHPAAGHAAEPFPQRACNPPVHVAGLPASGNLGVDPPRPQCHEVQAPL